MKCDTGPGDQHLNAIGRSKLKKTEAGPSLVLASSSASDPALYLTGVFFPVREITSLVKDHCL